MSRTSFRTTEEKGASAAHTHRHSNVPQPLPHPVGEGAAAVTLCWRRSSRNSLGFRAHISVLIFRPCCLAQLHFGTKKCLALGRSFVKSSGPACTLSVGKGMTQPVLGGLWTGPAERAAFVRPAPSPPRPCGAKSTQTFHFFLSRLLRCHLPPPSLSASELFTTPSSPPRPCRRRCSFSGQPKISPQPPLFCLPGYLFICEC